MRFGFKATPFMISLLSCVMIGIFGYGSLYIMDRIEHQKQSQGEAPTAEDLEAAREDFLSRLADATHAWRFRAATSGISFLADDWNGAKFLGPPPVPAARIKNGNGEESRWEGGEGAPVTRKAIHRHFQNLFRSVSAVTRVEFELLDWSAGRKGYHGRLKVEWAAWTWDGGMLEQTEEHEVTVRAGNRKLMESVRKSGWSRTTRGNSVPADLPSSGLCEGDPLGKLKLESDAPVSVEDLRTAFVLIFVNLGSGRELLLEWKELSKRVVWVFVQPERERVCNSLAQWGLKIDPAFVSEKDHLRLLGHFDHPLPTAFVVKDGIVIAKLVGTTGLKELPGMWD